MAESIMVGVDGGKGKIAAAARERLDTAVVEAVGGEGVSSSSARSSMATRHRRCVTARPARTCSWSGRAATAVSPDCCSAR